MIYPTIVLISIDWLKVGGWWQRDTTRVCPVVSPLFPFPAPEYARNYSHRCVRHGRVGTARLNFRKMA